MPALPPLPGEAHAVALHSGPGSGSLRDFATGWRAKAAELGAQADEIAHRGNSIDAHWSDGHHQAGANTRRHGAWFTSAQQQAAAIAATADGVADQFDDARMRTPTPQDFQNARESIRDAVASGNLPALVQAQTRYAGLQAEAVEAASGYHSGVSAATGRLGTPLPAAPPIADGDGDGDVQPYDNETGGDGPLTGEEIAERLKRLQNGLQDGIKQVGTEHEIFDLYEEFSKGGQQLPVPDNYYDRVVLPDGTILGVRESADHGPTLDVKYPPGVEGPDKVHLPPPPVPPPASPPPAGQAPITAPPPQLPVVDHPPAPGLIPPWAQIPAGVPQGPYPYRGLPPGVGIAPPPAPPALPAPALPGPGAAWPSLPPLTPQEKTQIGIGSVFAGILGFLGWLGTPKTALG
jgi:hypothetical protein